MIWFTADTHFGHAKVITHSQRLFSTIEEHDEQLIKNWNYCVGRGDVVYHLGDFAWHHPELYRARLNGQIHLIRGNHDRLKAANADLFCSVSDLKKVKVGDQKIYLCHYAMRVWNCSHHGAWHLYGHSHGSLFNDPKSLSLDVGVDVHDYMPVSYGTIARLMLDKTYEAVDHHHTPNL